MKNTNYGYKLGFACKVLTGDPKVDKTYNFTTTTVKSLSNKTEKEKKIFLQDLCFSNLEKLWKQISLIKNLDRHLKMFRIGSDLFPIFTHEVSKSVYSDSAFINDLQESLSELGKDVIKHEIRLSFHPGQFTVLGSLNENVVINSIDELEYHAKIFDWMGFSGWHPLGAAINIHGGSRSAGLHTLLKNISKCSSSVQNYLTIENDEFSYSIEDLELISQKVALVLDVHHQWIHKEEYLLLNDSYLNMIKSSWRGIRPKIHYSVSKKEYIETFFNENELPNISVLLENNIKKTLIREHGDDYWNNAVNDYVVMYLKDFDVMCEAKNKNQASEKLFEYYKSHGYY